MEIELGIFQFNGILRITEALTGSEQVIFKAIMMKARSVEYNSKTWPCGDQISIFLRESEL